MRIAWNALLYGICVNLALGIIISVTGIGPALAAAEEIEMKDPTEIVDTWNWGGTGSLVGDIGSGLRFFWDINIPFIESIIILAKNMGCPNEILDPIKIIWRFIWNTFIIEFITGRRIMYD